MRPAQADTVWTRRLFRLRLWFGARMLPFRIAGRSLPDMLSIYEPSGPMAHPRLPLDYIERSVRWAVRSPLLMRNRRCLRSGLLGYEALRRAGYAPELHFSVDQAGATADSIKAHCWVSIDGRPVINLPKAGHVLLFTHGRKQRAEPAE